MSKDRIKLIKQLATVDCGLPLINSDDFYGHAGPISDLWRSIRDDKNPRHTMKLLENCDEESAQERHNGESLYEMAVKRCSNLRLIQYMTENRLWHRSEEGFDFSIASSAILNSSEKIVEYLISKGLDLSDDKENGCGPLHIACSQNPNYKVIRVLIKNGCDVNLVDPVDGLTPFLIAASKNKNPGVLDELAKNGANIHARTNNGKTAMHLCARNNPNPYMITELCRLGLDINAVDDDGTTPFIQAVMNDNPDVAETVFHHGGHPIVRDKLNKNPLFFAASSNATCYVIPWLFRFGYDINEKNIEGRTALMYSSLNENETACRMFIEKGANLYDEDPMGKKAFVYILEQARDLDTINLLIEKTDFATNAETRWLFLAATAAYGETKALRLLVKHGLSLDAKSPDNRSLLHFSAANNPRGINIDFLVKSGLDVNLLDDHGATPFLYAARGNYSTEVFQKLLRRGANPKIELRGRRNALQVACEQNPSPEVVEYLIDKEFYSLEAKDDLGLTAFLYSTVNSNLDVMKLLFDKGANFLVVDNEDCNALCLAASNAKEAEMIDYLVETLGFDVNEKNKHGYDAIYFAASANPNEEVLKALINHGASVTGFYPNGLNLLMVAARFNINPAVVETILANQNVNINERSREPEPEEEQEAKADVIKEMELEEAEMATIRLGKIQKNSSSPNNKVYSKGTSAVLHAAANPNYAVLEMLIEKGANLEDCDKCGRNILNYAAGSNENPMVIRYIIQKLGFRTNKKDKNNASSLFDAVTNPNIEILQTILEYGGDIESVALGNITPLMIAAMVNPNPDIIKFLIAEGLSVHDTDDSGMTPLLHAAQSNENPEISEVLIAAGASVKDENSEGKNVFSISLENPNPMVHKALEKYANLASLENTFVLSSEKLN